jgi:molybdate transport system substrate-binding protein
MRKVAAALLAVLAGCGGTGSEITSGPGRSPEGTVRVFAATSLTGAFTEMKEPFEAENPRLTVDFNFAASSALVRQVEAGAAADVVVTADAATMQSLVDLGDVAETAVVARNRLIMVVERGNPHGIGELADLARAGLVVVLCAPEVPCGRLAADALRTAGVRVRPASLEENVGAVAAKVLLGEADAGIVYVTEARAKAEQLDAVAIDRAADPSLEAVYPEAVTRGAENAPGARAWVDFTLSGEGQAILARHGFLPR